MDSKSVFIVVCLVFIFTLAKAEEKKAISVLKGQIVSGILVFMQSGKDGPVKIQGNITGLIEGDHGFHIHEKGDLSNGCTSTGSHYNPDGKKHGGKTDSERHVGDLGNIIADKDGVAKIDITDSSITLSGRRSILGRAVVVHSDKDDFGRGGFPDSLTTGHAGSRVACGIIGILDPVNEWDTSTASRLPYHNNEIVYLFAIAVLFSRLL